MVIDGHFWPDTPFYVLEQSAVMMTNTPRAQRIGDIGWITHRQGILYAQEYEWDQTLEALIAEIAAAFVKELSPDVGDGPGQAAAT